MRPSKNHTRVKKEAFRLGRYRIGEGHPFFFIGGPCALESEAMAIRHAKAIQKITSDLGIPFVFKTSFDKANRSSIESFRGPGLKRGLDILRRIKRETGVMLLSDIHTPDQAEAAAEVLDILQIPAFLCRQTDLLIAAARTGKIVNVKKGQFVAPEDMRHAIQKILREGNSKIWLTERGTTFGYHNLVSDFRSLVIMRDFGFPVIFDATHSVQQPSLLTKSSGGQGQFVGPLARAAVSVGCDGLFMEVHENPSRALSDGPNMVRLKDLRALLLRLKAIHRTSHHAS